MNALRGENLREMLDLIEKAEMKMDGRAGFRYRRAGFTQLALVSSKNVVEIKRKPARWLKAPERERKAHKQLKSTDATTTQDGQFSQTSVSATWFRVKNNVLVGYPDQGLFCKFRRPESFRSLSALRNEFETLQIISASRAINAPEPVAYFDEPMPTVWMKYIKGRKTQLKDKPAITRAIAEALINWYEYSNVKPVLVSSYPPLLEFLAKGKVWLLKQGWTEREAEVIRKALGNAANSPLLSLESQVHGDASIGNSIVDLKGRLIITDWEMSRIDLVAHDFLKLHQAPGVDELYTAWREKILGPSRISTQHELALVALIKGLNLDDRRRYLLNLSSSPEVALRRMEVFRRSIIEKANMLSVPEW